VGDLMRARLPPDIVVEEVALAEFVAPALFASEEALLHRAMAKRRREFTAGRALARRAMARLGIPEVPLLPGPARAPQWPAGIVGSITHTRTHCAVAVGRAETLRGIGIDLEPDEPIRPELFAMLCTPSELAAIARLDARDGGRACRLLFSAKESAYKAQFAITQTFLPFSAMTIAVDEGAGRFEARLEVDVGDAFRRGDVLEGSFGRRDAMLATAVVIDR
jgi:4'-phosphopantetheinyl transferase EntD